MPKSIVTSNTSQVSARFKRMARNLPGVVDKSIHDLVDEEALPLFEKTVATWQRQPRFMTRKTARGYGIEVDPLFPFEYVDKGTRAHPIEARNVPLLRFMGPYHAKTKVNVISSYHGGRGRVWVSKRMVQHPGIEARNFSDIILKRVQARAVNRIKKDLSDASYGAGTGI